MRLNLITLAASLCLAAGIAPIQAHAESFSAVVRTSPANAAAAVRQAAREVCARAVDADWTGEYASIEECVNDSVNTAHARASEDGYAAAGGTGVSQP